MKSKVSFRFARRLSRASARTLSTDGAYSCRVSRIVTDALSVRTEITLKSCAVKLNVSSTLSATCPRFRKSSGTPNALAAHSIRSSSILTLKQGSRYLHDTSAPSASPFPLRFQQDHFVSPPEWTSRSRPPRSRLSYLLSQRSRPDPNRWIPQSLQSQSTERRHQIESSCA